ncbi:MAG: hypothetical protein ACPGJE_01365 [Wenzhouxiangellaceae bacterium]
MTQLKTILIALSALMLAACAPPPSDEEVVTQRAQERWDALVSGDFEGSYAYQSPGYRQQTSAIEHVVGLSRRQIVWTAANVTEVDCEESRCQVTINVAYRADGAPGVLSGLKNERPVREIWVRLDDQWWYSES